MSFYTVHSFSSPNKSGMLFDLIWGAIKGIGKGIVWVVKTIAKLFKKKGGI